MTDSFLSPAVVNLFLRVVGKHPDGSPNMVSFSQTVDLCDTLQIELSDQDQLICNHSSVPTGRGNAIWKAAELFRVKTGKDFSVKINLDKKIPINSGLCGSVSNAATTLWALNQLMGNEAHPEDLKKWSAEIDYMCPSFFTTGTSLYRNQHEDHPTFLSQTLFIATPIQKIPQSVLFSRLTLDELDHRDVDAVIEQVERGEISHFNDLEDAAFALYPKLALLKQKLLQSGYQHVTMTGSGPSLVCFGEVDRFPTLPKDYLHFKTSPISRKIDQWY